MLHPRARTMLVLAIPALIIGVASSLVLIVVMKIVDSTPGHPGRQYGFSRMDYFHADADRYRGGSGDSL